MNLVKISVALAAWLLVVTNVSAYYLDAGEIKSGASGSFVTGGSTGASYLGHMGHVHLGLPPSKRGPSNYPDIGTDYEFTGVTYPDYFDEAKYELRSVQTLHLAGALTVHWFQFASTPETFDTLSAYYEWDAGITSFQVDFFFEGDATDTSIHTASFDGDFLDAYGHAYEDYFASFPEGDWLMRVQGQGSGPNNGYVVQLYPQAVPLPPAVLLFGSAIAAFGVIGRRRKQRLAS